MFSYSANGETYTVQLERLPDGTYRATINTRSYHFDARAVDGGWLLSFLENGARTTAYVVTDGDIRWVSARGESYTLTRVSPRQGRSAIAPGRHGGDVIAQMPGQVQQVLASAGDTVLRGQVLVILEAMKMELRATATTDGKVKSMLVSAGDVVARGQLLAVIE
jgi:biotin carboxyl carrier protein